MEEKIIKKVSKGGKKLILTFGDQGKQCQSGAEYNVGNGNIEPLLHLLFEIHSQSSSSEKSNTSSMVSPKNRAIL